MQVNVLTQFKTINKMVGALGSIWSYLDSWCEIQGRWIIRLLVTMSICCSNDLVK